MFSKSVAKLVARTGTIVLAFALAQANVAKADYPGEVWSIDALEIRNDSGSTGLMTKELRAGMQRANETYFFGERAMRMVVEGVPGAGGAMRLTLIEQATGEVVARSSKLPVTDDGASIQAKALAWMEGLNCAAVGCAAAPEAVQPVRVAKARVDAPLKPETTVEHHGRIIGPGIEPVESGVPIPVSRPGAEPKAGKRGKARIYPSGLSAKDLNAAISSLQIAWAIPREVGALTYSDADTLVLDDALQLARATPLTPVAAAPVRPIRSIPTALPQDNSLFVRLIDTVADLFTIGPGSTRAPTAIAASTPQQQTVSVTPSTSDAVLPKAQETGVAQPVLTEPVEAEPVVAAAPADGDAPAADAVQPRKTPAPSVGSIVRPAGTGSAWVRASDAVTLINPIDRFRSDPNLRGVSDGERIAVADIRAQLTDPANVRATQLSAAAVTPGALLRPSPNDSDILLATAQPTRQTTTQLSVKLAPELLGRYSASALAGLKPRRNNRLKKAAVGARAPSDATRLNTVLKERGLELNLAGYNRFERIYWGGEGDDGFWISLPNRVNAKFVLVSGPTSSVIAAVRRRSGIARASRGVADALELKPREWSKLRVISLRPDNQSAALPFLVWSSVLKGREVAQ